MFPLLINMESNCPITPSKEEHITPAYEVGDLKDAQLKERVLQIMNKYPPQTPPKIPGLQLEKIISVGTTALNTPMNQKLA